MRRLTAFATRADNLQAYSTAALHGLEVHAVPLCLQDDAFAVPDNDRSVPVSSGTACRAIQGHWLDPSYWPSSRHQGCSASARYFQ